VEESSDGLNVRVYTFVAGFEIGTATLYLFRSVASWVVEKDYRAREWNVSESYFLPYAFHRWKPIIKQKIEKRKKKGIWRPGGGNDVKKRLRRKEKKTRKLYHYTCTIVYSRTTRTFHMIPRRPVYGRRVVFVPRAGFLELSNETLAGTRVSFVWKTLSRPVLLVQSASTIYYRPRAST